MGPSDTHSTYSAQQNPAQLKSSSAKGRFYLLCSIFSFTLMQIVLKELKGVPIFQIVFFRGLIALLISGATLAFRADDPRKGPALLLLARGLFGTFSIFLFVQSVQSLEMASAASLQYLAPLFTVLFAGPLLKEWPSVGILFAFLMSCVGVFILNGFDFSNLNLSICIGVASALSSGISYNIIRMLHGRASPDVVVFWFSGVIVAISGISTVFGWENPGRLALLYLILAGLCSHFGQVFLTRSYQVVPAAQIAYFNYLGVLLAVFCGLVFYNEQLKTHAFLGICFILGGVYLANRLKPDSKTIVEAMPARPD